MKKLSALILSISLIGFLSTTASAAPCDCGYTFDIGPGTLVQIIEENVATHVTTAISQDVTSDCDIAGTKFYVAAQGPDNTACTDAVLIRPHIVNSGDDGTYGTTDDWLYARNSVYNQCADELGGVLTATFVDFRDTYTGGAPAWCDAIITDQYVDYMNTFLYGNYTSTQNVDCQPDMTAPTPDNANSYEGFSDQLWYGYIGVPADRKGVKFKFRGYNAPGTTVAQFIPPTTLRLTINTQMSLTRVEYFDNLRSDLNGDGIVSLTDFNIFKAEYGQSNQCWCSGYYQ